MLNIFNHFKRFNQSTNLLIDMDVNFGPIYATTKPFTMTSVERMYSMYEAVKYVTNSNIGGDIVECGVWKGGSSMVAALTMKKLRDMKRKIYLYDTYAGMSEPTNLDVPTTGISSVRDIWLRNQSNGVNLWCYSSLNEVKANLYSTGYPINKLVFVAGDVEQTIPKVMPKKISLLRLDTDWYKSTHHELKYLFPRLSRGGVLIIDDYGHWKGARLAVDKYIKENKIKILLSRIDYTGRIGVKS